MTTKNEKYALITGATSGIGLELAKLFAKDGYNQVIVARNSSELQQTAIELKEYGINVITISKDLFKTNAAQEVYDEVDSLGIKIDVLVNNAGHSYFGDFVHADLEMELNIIQLNIVSLVSLTKLFLKGMLHRREGKILNTSSITSKSPGPWQAVYDGTTAFIASFTESVRQEVKGTGVTLTTLLPGATDTDFFNKANMSESKVIQDKTNLAHPADVARDGYEALMAGKKMVISRAQNRNNGISIDTLLSDEMGAK